MKNTFVKCVLLVLLMTTTKTFAWPQQRITAIDFMYNELKSYKDQKVAMIVFVGFAGSLYDAGFQYESFDNKMVAEIRNIMRRSDLEDNMTKLLNMSTDVEMAIYIFCSTLGVSRYGMNWAMQLWVECLLGDK